MTERVQKTFPYDAVIADSNRKLFLCEKGKIRALPTVGCAFSVFARRDGTILYSSICDGTTSGLVLCDRTGNTLARCRTENEVFGVHELPQGGYLVGELSGKCVTRLDASLQVVSRFFVKYNGENLHEVMRGVYPARDGNVFVVQPGDRMIRKYDYSGTVLAEIPTGPDTFGMEEKENGNLIYTQHTALCEIDSAGRELWRVDAADILPAGLCWALNFRTLPSGHILLVNWLGHGCEGQGFPVIELDENHALYALYPICEDAVNIADLDLLPRF